MKSIWIKLPRNFLSIFFFQIKANSQTLTLVPSNYHGYNVSCFGSATGSINLTISGGTPPYTIAWSNAATTEDISNLTAGYYRVSVDDADPLSGPKEAEITLTEPRQLGFDFVSPKYPNDFNISIFGACNGSIQTTVADGVSPYTYLWNDNSTLQNRNSLCAATYDVVVTDLNGCTKKIKNIVLTQPDRSDWQMSGNSNVNPSTQFIGTIDNNDLVFKTNSIDRFKL